MIHFIKLHPTQCVTGKDLVWIYNDVANKVNPGISRSHIPLNVHRFAKKYGQSCGTAISINGRKTTVYSFNF